MSNPSRRIRGRFLQLWSMFWLRRSGGDSLCGRLAAWLASRHLAPYHARSGLAWLLPRGFIDPSARVNHPGLVLGAHTYLGAGVMVCQSDGGGRIELMDRVQIYGDSFIETGMAGEIHIGEDTHIQPGCHIHSYLSRIRIGRKVEIAPNCAFYNYDHGMKPGTPIMDQPLQSKGDIVVGDGVWLGHGSTVLQGVTIGEGAVIAAGSVVVGDVPDQAIAAGVPARVLRYRDGRHPT